MNVVETWIGGVIARVTSSTQPSACAARLSRGYIFIGHSRCYARRLGVGRGLVPSQARAWCGSMSTPTSPCLEPPPIPLDDLADEAQLIAEQAVRLALANALLLRAARRPRLLGARDALTSRVQSPNRLASETERGARGSSRARDRARRLGPARAARPRWGPSSPSGVHTASKDDDVARGMVGRARDRPSTTS